MRLGTINLAAFALGVCSLWCWTSLPGPVVLAWLVLPLIIVTMGLPAWLRARILFALLGKLWALWLVGVALDQRLAPALEGEDLRAIGQIRDLPRSDIDAVRFRFCPEQVWLHDEPLPVSGCWRLGWYQPRPRRGDAPSASATVPELLPGQRWQLTVRLKRPRGLVNPGGFDSERKALETGISASGHVRSGGDNRQLSPSGGVDAWRGAIATRIDHAETDPRIASLLRGLAVGDRRDFADRDWSTLRRTGVGHLFSISGLHVGMVAVFVGALAMAATWFFPALLRLAPRRYWALPPALLAAAGYALLAGFEVPTQRTLAMIAAAGLALLLRRRIGLWQGWCLALAVVLLIDPLAMTSLGFWLSYGGVAWLLLAGQGRAPQPMWRSAVQAQWAVSIGLLPIGIGFFAQASWVSPLVNLVAIPWVTVLVVPVLLLSLPAMWLWPVAADALVRLSGWLLAPLMAALDAISDWPGAAAWLPEPGAFAVAAAVLVAVVFLLPVAHVVRLMALPLLLPLLWPATPPLPDGGIQLHVLDVGQGTSVLVRTRRHALLFDTGARHANGFDMGEAVVVPALRALGVRRLDALVLSHADNDHAGGAGAVLREFPVSRVLLGEPVDDVSGGPCHAPESWRWDGVYFHLLHPPPRYPARGNEVSCVLKIDASQGSALLTGDAGEVAELRMLNLHRDRLPTDVLLLGHHGSRHSSTPAFLDAVTPTLAIATAGYRNRYDHPQPVVRQRLAVRGIELLTTADTGALRIDFEDGAADVVARRASHRRFWHEP